jgi:uncharacterized repeat protein (TIGR01451 family)
VGKHLTFIGLVLLAALSYVAAAIAAPGTPPGTVVSNIAQVDFTAGGLSLSEWSNEENFIVVAAGIGGGPADIRLTKRASRIVAGVGEVVMYTLKVENIGADATNVTVQDQLPAELRFRDTVPASGTLAEFTPTTADGKLLIFSIGPLAAGASVEFAYYAEVVAGAEYGFSTNKAQAFDAVANRVSNVATATILIKQDVFNDVSFIAGRVYAGTCDPGQGAGVSGVRVYLEDGTVATTDQLGRYHIEGTKPGLHVVAIDKSSLPAGLTPMQCRKNSRNGGAGDIQFVDTQGGSLWRADFVLAGKAQPAAAAVPMSGPTIDNGLWTQDRLQKWIDTAPKKFDFVAPGEDFYPPLGSITIVIAHHPDDKVELTRDGELVSALNVERTVFNATKTWAATQWRGVAINPGDNLFMAVAVNKAGEKGERVGRTIHFSAPPVAAALDPSKSTLIADGKTVPVVAIKLTSPGNHQARPGTFVDYSVEAPYQRQQTVDPNAPTSHLMPSRAAVGEGGVIRVPLAPTIVSGEARIRVRLADGEEVVKAWLSAGTAATFLVALAEGTAGANAISGNPDGKIPDNAADDLFADGRVAFFFKSMILGDWMLKAGYDSKRSENERDALGKAVDPKRYFPVYGDASKTEHEMDSSGPLFVHVERKNFMIRYGNFDTALSTAQLARYERRLSGLQSAYRGENFGYKAFVSETKNRFVKDEIKGNGTSGLYRLSTHPILINSERVKIEERDRFRNGEVLSVRNLVRYIDYEIDYEFGTLFFKEPVQSHNTELNPLVIVADYEARGEGKRTLNYGGRVAAYAFDGDLELGASAIHQGVDGGKGANLYGVDVAAKVAPGTVVKAEYARSRDGPKGPGKADAYSVELKHDSQAFSGRLYVREQDELFGLEQQNSGQSGAREYGVEARARLDDVAKGLGVQAKAYHRESTQIAGAREFGELMITWTTPEVDLGIGVRRVKDDTLGPGDAISDQILSRAIYRIDERMSVRIAHEQTVRGRNSNPDYPTRTIFGIDYRITDNLTFVAAHELIDGANDKGTITRAGFEGSMWTGGRFKTSAQRDLTGTSEDIFANVGLAQDWQIDDGWSVSASIDRQQRVYATGEDNGGLGGAGDRESYTAVSLGTAVDTNLGKITARVETRLGSHDRWNFALGHYLSPTGNLSFANNFRFLYENPETGSEVVTAMMQLGAAYRPADGTIVLSRVDFGYESDPRAEAASGVVRSTWKFVNNTLVNMQPSNDFELSMMLGLKYAVDEVMGMRYSNFSSMTGFEARYDITDDIDIGMRGSALVNWTSSTVLYSVGPSIGYALSESIWVSAGYNLMGYEDEDFTAAGYTSSGVFVQFRARLDSSDAEEAAKWFSEN